MGTAVLFPSRNIGFSSFSFSAPAPNVLKEEWDESVIIGGPRDHLESTSLFLRKLVSMNNYPLSQLFSIITILIQRSSLQPIIPLLFWGWNFWELATRIDHILRVLYSFVFTLVYRLLTSFHEIQTSVEKSLLENLWSRCQYWRQQSAKFLVLAKLDPLMIKSITLSRNYRYPGKSEGWSYQKVGLLLLLAV